MFRMVNGQKVDMTSEEIAERNAEIAANQTIINRQSLLSNAMVALESGIAITSTGTPAINGTYPTDQNAQNKVNGLATYVMLNGTFPKGKATMDWFDTSGVTRTFPSVAVFKAFATAFADYVSEILLYADSGGNAGSIPSNEITIS